AAFSSGSVTKLQPINPMKTNYFSVRLTVLLIAITATLVAQSARAGAINTIDITENSSSSLTVVANGTTLPSSDINNTSADHWTVTLPFAVNPAGNGISNFIWSEPDLLNVNIVTWTSSSTEINIVSDGFPIGVNQGTTDGGTLSTSDANYTFHDLGDAATTPDTGSTLGLLGLALAALFGASRLRSIRSA